MKKIASVGILAILMTSGAVLGVPARPLYEPEMIPLPTVRANVAGTSWEGTLFSSGSKITFKDGGLLEYGEAGNISPGIWRMEGEILRFEINQYSEYKTVIKGNVIEGEGSNRGGMQCKVRLLRVR